MLFCKVSPFRGLNRYYSNRNTQIRWVLPTSALFYLVLLLSPRLCQCQTGLCQGTTDITSCGAGHVCVEVTFGASACLCAPGYAPTGSKDEKCQKIDICNAGFPVCFHSGTCTRDAVDPLKYTCNCAQGFAGTNCERAENICDTAGNCQNGGSCVVSSTSSRGFLCVCPRGYTGDSCEVAASIGIGGAGVALTGGSLVILWGLWIAMAMTFLYCSMSLITGWWTNRVRKVATQAATASVTPS